MEHTVGTHGFRRLYLATLNTLRGLKFATQSEAALREELLLLAAAVPLAFSWRPTSPGTWRWWARCSQFSRSSS